MAGFIIRPRRAWFGFGQIKSWQIGYQNSYGFGPINEYATKEEALAALTPLKLLQRGVSI